MSFTYIFAILTLISVLQRDPLTRLEWTHRNAVSDMSLHVPNN